MQAGLSEAELNLCSHNCGIVATDNGSLNLSHAVAVVLSEASAYVLLQSCTHLTPSMLSQLCPHSTHVSLHMRLTAPLHFSPLFPTPLMLPHPTHASLPA